MDEIVVVMGMNAGGKTTHTQKYVDQGYVRINRDEIGGKLMDLHHHLDAAIKKGARKLVLDNTFAEASSRKGSIDVAKSHDLPIRCELIDTSIDDAQVNACYRMIDRVGRVLMHNDEFKPIKDPNVFPIAALYSYRKRFEKPTTEEGFSRIDKIKFVRKYPDGANKAVIFDMDDTVRYLKEGSGFTQKYPTEIEHVAILPGRIKRIQQCEKEGYVILGASNQSGIAKKHLTKEKAEKIFEHTCGLLGIHIDIRFCPHAVPPIQCYCRKPNPGMLVQLIHDYKLDPRKCVMVGDQTSDRNAALKVGFQYQDQAEFFK